MAMGCRIGDDSGPGRDGRRPGAPIPIWPGNLQLACFGSYPNGQRRPPNSGGGGSAARSATYAVNDVFRVNQARITKGIGGWGMTCEEDKWRDQMIGIVPHSYYFEMSTGISFEY